jgi:hypothetical protein
LVIYKLGGGVGVGIGVGVLVGSGVELGRKVNVVVGVADAESSRPGSNPDRLHANENKHKVTNIKLFLTTVRL